MWVQIPGFPQSQTLGLFVHLPDERPQRVLPFPIEPTSQESPHRHRGVIPGRQQHPVQQLAQRQAIARLEIAA